MSLAFWAETGKLYHKENRYQSGLLKKWGKCGTRLGNCMSTSEREAAQAGKRPCPRCFDPNHRQQRSPIHFKGTPEYDRTGRILR